MSKRCNHNFIINRANAIMCEECGITLNKYLSQLEDRIFKLESSNNKLNMPDMFECICSRLEMMCQEIHGMLLQTIPDITNVFCIGSFDMETNNMILSDPCYMLETWCSARVCAKKGRWYAFVAKVDAGDCWGIRNAILFAVHEDHIGENVDPLYYDELLSSDVGVDSGQSGIYDEAYYRHDEVIKHLVDVYWGNEKPICTEEPWYSANCARTLQKPHAGIVPHGCVASSGFGDGCYNAYGVKDANGECTHISIVFIPPENHLYDE